MTVDLFDGCASSQAGRSRGVQSRRASSAEVKGRSLGSPTNEAFQRNLEFAVEAADHFQG
jgi:hypothetical protein